VLVGRREGERESGARRVGCRGRPCARDAAAAVCAASVERPRLRHAACARRQPAGTSAAAPASWTLLAMPQHEKETLGMPQRPGRVRLLICFRHISADESRRSAATVEAWTREPPRGTARQTQLHTCRRQRAATPLAAQICCLRRSTLWCGVIGQRCDARQGAHRACPHGPSSCRVLVQRRRRETLTSARLIPVTRVCVCNSTMAARFCPDQTLLCASSRSELRE
jgi:hypothetical protein